MYHHFQYTPDGTGGRDLKSEVQGKTALQGLDLLQRDPETKVIVLVSKPPDLDVASNMLAGIRKSTKPVVVQFMGFAPITLQSGNLHFSLNFGMTASRAVELVESGSVWDESNKEKVNPEEKKHFLRGLFSGGSLANEVLQALQISLFPIYSNIPLRESQRLPDPFKSQGHTVLDLGADEFTVGRLHPMMDYELRMRFLRKEAADPEVALILMDVVLGEGAHPDPAREMSGVIAEVIQNHSVEVAIILIGTNEDPQDLQQQKLRLTEAGARVFEDSLRAVEYIHRRFQMDTFGQAKPVPLEILQEPICAINVGLETFYQSLISQGASAVHVDWRPPAGGDEELLSILEKMRS